MSSLTHQDALLLVGAAVAAGCRPCLDTALGRCLELGVNAADISRAREIGAMAAQRARSDMEEHSEEALAEFFPQLKNAPSTIACPCTAPPKCGCQANG